MILKICGWLNLLWYMYRTFSLHTNRLTSCDLILLLVCAKQGYLLLSIVAIVSLATLLPPAGLVTDVGWMVIVVLLVSWLGFLSCLCFAPFMRQGTSCPRWVALLTSPTLFVAYSLVATRAGEL